MEFINGGFAGVLACFFTNPLEVVKTRMQLQGELQARGSHERPYKNVFHAAYVVAQRDGLLALQKGLVPCFWTQFFYNGVRLGIYQLLDVHGYIRDKNGELIFANSLIISSIGGLAGQFACSPFFLVKTHLQAQSSQIAIGYQHEHKGMTEAMLKIYRAYGIKGLFRGAGASLPRSVVMSASQLVAFDYSKQFLRKYAFFDNRPISLSFWGSMVGGIAITLLGNPFELVMTRIYNQPVDQSGKGLMYAGFMDCVRKIYYEEGLIAFYKGIGPLYFRLGPHTVLLLVFWDELNAIYYKWIGTG